MDTSLLNSDNIYDAESGHFISAHHQRIAEVVAEYNPELRVVWIPTTERTATSPKPYGIAHFPDGKEPYVFMMITEEEMNHPTRVIEMLIEADQAATGTNNGVFAKLNRAADAAALMREAEKREKLEEMHDRAKSMFRSNNSRYQLGGGRTVDLSA